MYLLKYHENSNAACQSNVTAYATLEKCSMQIARQISFDIFAGRGYANLYKSHDGQRAWGIYPAFSKRGGGGYGKRPRRSPDRRGPEEKGAVG